jgi:hypothetical protein
MSQEDRILTTVSRLMYGEEIVKFCLEPKATSDINALFKQLRARSPFSLGGQQTFIDHLKKLEEAGAITYSNDKWQTTQEARNLVAKYVG